MGEYPKYESAGRPVDYEQPGQRKRGIPKLDKKGYAILAVAIIAVGLFVYTSQYEGKIDLTQIFSGGKPQSVIIQLVNDTSWLPSIFDVNVRNFPSTPPEPEILVQTASAAKYMNASEVYEGWERWDFDISNGSRILSVDFSISTSQHTHVKFFLIDGWYDHGQVVDDTRIRTDILAQVDCADRGSTVMSYNLHGYVVKDTLRLSVWAHNMEDHETAWHGSCTIYYTE